MIGSFDKSETPDLGRFPSARAQDSTPVDTVRPAARGRFGILRIVGKFFLTLIILATLAGGGLVLLLSRGPVSNDQLKAQVETQLSELLGPGQSAQIESMKFALGAGGLLAFKAQNLRILDTNKTNLGVAGEVSVAVKALPLLRGQLVAKRVIVKNASLSLSPFFNGRADPGMSENAVATPWPAEADMAKMFNELLTVLDQMLAGFEEAGVEELSFSESKIIGFERVGLRSHSARIASLFVEKDARFRTGLSLRALIETEHANWQLQGEWRHKDDGSKALALKVNGMDLREFLPNTGPDDKRKFYIDSPIEVELDMPFAVDGTPQQALLNVLVDEGRLRVDIDHDSRFMGGRLNFRLLPEKNQIELERSPVLFPSAKAMLVGGLRFPRPGKLQGDIEHPIFELIANEVQSRALLPKASPAHAAIRANGWIDAANRTLNAEELSVTSKTGGITGTGAFGFTGDTPSMKLDLKVASIDVDEFKQLWHPSIAPKLRSWVSDGITGGTIKNAWVKADVPAGVLGNFDRGKRFGKDEMTAHVPIVGANVKTFGALPKIKNVSGIVNQTDMTSSVSVDSGSVEMSGGRKVAVSEGQLDIGDFSLKSIPTLLSMKLDSTASAAAQLGTFEPLNFTERLDVNPADLTGAVTAKAKVGFNLEDGGSVSDVDWLADVALTGFSSKKPISGRKFSKANLKIKADKKVAKINGTANIDGVSAKVAMVEQMNGKGSGQRSVTFSLDDAARKRLGIDTDGLMTGVMEVSVSQADDGYQHIDADLRKVKLSLPWIKWAKGKGIPATASFDYKTVKGVQRLENFQLRGAGFQALGKLALDKRGLVSVNMANVRLNKTDDLAVTAQRTKGGFEIKINAKSYDGRAIIQTFLKNDENDPTATSKETVTVRGTIGRLQGFNGQSLTGVTIDYKQRNGRVVNAKISAVASGGAPTTFVMRPSADGKRTRLRSSNGGSVLQFLDLYSKIRGGDLNVSLVQGKSGVYVGKVSAKNFYLLDEPKLGQLMQPPRRSASSNDRDDRKAIQKVAKVDPRKVKISTVTASIAMGKKSLRVKNGRIRGGDAGAAFEGRVYDAKGRTSMSGTFLPAYGLNRLVSKIPVLGLAFGRGKKDGLIGITFKLSGPYKNPDLIVNPVSILAPGVFRKIFEY